jgi:Tol biopolymer transport system component
LTGKADWSLPHGAWFGLTVAICWALILGAWAESAAAACPNEDFRSGASAHLPDCRAYELVTPPDSGGRLFFTIEAELPYNLFPTELLSASGESAIFMTKGGALREPTGGNGTRDLYQAQRTTSGWKVTRRLTPSGAEAALPNPGGVSSDHQYTFIEARPGLPEEFGGSLGEEGDATYLGNPNGSFELLGVGSSGTERPVQGRFISPGGQHIIFSTGDSEWCVVTECPTAQLEPSAPPTGTAAVYDRAPDGPTQVVSLLPGNVTPGSGENAAYQGTSADGSVVAFKIAGTLYVRVEDSETKKVTEAPSTFAGLSADGGQIFYVSEGNIFRFDTQSGETQAATSSGDAEVVNVSADGSHVYFVSPTALPETAAEPGLPNLYVWDASDEETTFVATVAFADVEGRPALNTWTSLAVAPEKNIGQGPGADSSRTTPDGQFLVFESRAQLTSYPNEGHVEIYRYSTEGPGLQCVSCAPSGEPATANARLENLEQLNIQSGGESMLIHNLSVDGGRVFFETPERLVQGDVDGVNDIYEWHVIESGPTVDLISSGNSIFYTNPLAPAEFQEPNTMFAISPSGGDVLFRTPDQLLSAAGGGGAEALYDARIGGGFPESELSPCKEQVCEGIAPGVPALETPQSAAFHGHGNVRRHHRHRCRHGKRKARSGKHRACHHSHHKKGSAK